jgi:hypothetical protein
VKGFGFSRISRQQTSTNLIYAYTEKNFQSHGYPGGIHSVAAKRPGWLYPLFSSERKRGTGS